MLLRLLVLRRLPCRRRRVKLLLPLLLRLKAREPGQTRLPLRRTKAGLHTIAHARTKTIPKALRYHRRRDYTRPNTFLSVSYDPPSTTSATLSRPPLTTSVYLYLSRSN